mmetsp:Transcript_38676/g.69599  ORF Transcript_38676/g.69599 Transcript_38676/m.69599 type:complete len:258 (+) Transcript_38676:1729-2502(+)
MLHQRGQALDPVAIVAIEHAIDFADLGVMDVATDDAVRAALLGLASDGVFEFVDVTDGPFDLVLEVTRKAPVRQAELGADVVEPAVDLECEFVGQVTGNGQPARALDDAVVQVSMRDPQALAVRRHVHGLFHHVDTAKVVREILARKLVVIARDEDHAGALARLAQQLLHHVVVGLRPIPGTLELPAVDDVADQVERFAFDITEEVEQCLGLATRRAQVQVRNPDRTHRQRWHVGGDSDFGLEILRRRHGGHAARRS